MDKNIRQQRISDIIRQQRIATQEELIALLDAADCGANQSSISRDLIELGIIKVKGLYALPENKTAFFGLLSLETAGENMIVAKCEAGLASAICVKIDRSEIEEIVGTIAGDDTIFIAVRDFKSQKAAIRKIRENVV